MKERTRQQWIDYQKNQRRKARREAALREAGVITEIVRKRGSIKILAMVTKTKDTTAFDKAVKEASERIESRYKTK